MRPRSVHILSTFREFLKRSKPSQLFLSRCFDLNTWVSD
nr:MAG TPA: hypothetical protein [Caudoviricetes sp.]